MKRTFINIVLFTMNTLSMAGDGTEDQGGIGSFTGTDEVANDEVLTAVARATAETEVETVEEPIEGEASETPTYPFASKLEAAINAALGDNDIDNPGAVVSSEFCSLLYRSGIGPDVFAPLLGQGSNAMAAQS